MRGVCQRQNHKGKFADLRNTRPEGKRAAEIHAARFKRARRAERLRQNRARERQKTDDRMLKDVGKVCHHAERDKEHCGERLAERHNERVDLVCEPILPERDAGRERAERGREAEQFRDEAHAHEDENRIENDHVVGLQFRQSRNRVIDVCELQDEYDRAERKGFKRHVDPRILNPERDVAAAFGSENARQNEEKRNER